MSSSNHTAKTRIRPVFQQLYEADQTGEAWLGPLLALAGRAAEVAPAASEAGEEAVPEETAPIGSLLRPPLLEHAIPPPMDYLEFLVRNPRKLRWPRDADGEPRKYRPAVNLRRKALLAGDVPAQQEAIREIRQEQAKEELKGRDPDLKGWWVLESGTTVDCALYAEGYTLFIEGKRDEKSLKAHTNWYEKRIQLYRNLDALRAMPDRAERYGVLAIVEEGTPIHREAVAMQRDFQFARGSWPHLDNEAAAELWQHYLGFTTWQRVAEQFPFIELPK